MKGTIAVIAIVLILAFGAFLLLSLVLKWCWNSTLPKLVGVPCISYWQAIKLKLIVVCLLPWWGITNYLGKS